MKSKIVAFFYFLLSTILFFSSVVGIEVLPEEPTSLDKISIMREGATIFIVVETKKLIKESSTQWVMQVAYQYDQVLMRVKAGVVIEKKTLKNITTHPLSNTYYINDNWFLIGQIGLNRTVYQILVEDKYQKIDRDFGRYFPGLKSLNKNAIELYLADYAKLHKRERLYSLMFMESSYKKAEFTSTTKPIIEVRHTRNLFYKSLSVMVNGKEHFIFSHISWRMIIVTMLALLALYSLYCGLRTLYVGEDTETEVESGT